MASPAPAPLPATPRAIPRASQPTSVAELAKMFPSVERGTVESLLSTYGGDMSSAVEQLAYMTAPSPMHSPASLRATHSTTVHVGGENGSSRTAAQRGAEASSAAEALSPGTARARMNFDPSVDLAEPEVQWYMQDDKDRWLPFSRHDTYVLEMAFRAKPSPPPPPPSASAQHHAGATPPLPQRETAAGEGDSYIAVRGGLYDGNITRRTCAPVYWTGKSVSIMRGTWFQASLTGDWRPLDETMAEQLEIAFRCRPWEATQRFNIADGSHFAMFYGSDDVWLFSDDVTSRIGRSIGEAVGKIERVGGTRLKRGYRPRDAVHRCDVADALVGADFANARAAAPGSIPLSDECRHVRHVVLVVHGIGQKLDAYCNIVDDVNALRQAANAVAPVHFAEEWGKSRVEFLPVQWRRGLTLPGDGKGEGEVAGVEDITLDGIRTLRNILNGTMLDILYYMSQRHLRWIVDRLVRELNDIYGKFVARNPSFLLNGGTVSIIGHSLGSVIVFDILCAQQRPQHAPVNTTASSADPLGDAVAQEIALLEARLAALRDRQKAAGTPVADDAEGSADHVMDHVQVTPIGRLTFPVHTMFALGSPLGCFLTLRGLVLGRPGARPLCDRVYNVYHPYDPVAYRLEPVISRRLMDVRAEFVPYHKGGKRIHLEIQDLGQNITDRANQISQTFMASVTSIRGTLSRAFRIGGDGAVLAQQQVADDPAEAQREPIELLREFNPDGRLDFVLQDHPIESQYLSAINSHMGYWHNPDVALFLLARVYTEPPSYPRE